MRPPSGSIRAQPMGTLRPPTSTLRRMGTASQGNPGKIAYLEKKREKMSNSQRLHVFFSFSAIAPLNTSLSLEARPVTQQGLDGARMKTAGPVRQIADKTYYLAELRTKMSEIGREIRVLTDESTKLTRDTQVFFRRPCFNVTLHSTLSPPPRGYFL